MGLSDTVLCLRRVDLPIGWLGHRVAAPQSWPAFQAATHGAVCQWLIRREAETNPAMKQIIPYIIAQDGACVAAYPRQGSERRLSGLWSVGIGGHIEQSDDRGELKGTVLAGARRELQEELSGAPNPDLELLGIINEETSDVGVVHLGLVFAIQVKATTLKPGHELRGLRWVSRSAADPLDLELWSRLALALLPESVPPRAAANAAHAP